MQQLCDAVLLLYMNRKNVMLFVHVKPAILLMAISEATFRCSEAFITWRVGGGGVSGPSVCALEASDADPVGEECRGGCLYI